MKRAHRRPQIETLEGRTLLAADAGMVAWYKLDEGSGTIAADASGTGNTGTLVSNPAWTSGRFGSALNFGATTTARVTAADKASLDITGPLSISAWVRPTARVTQYIVKKARSDSVDGYELGMSSTGRLFFRLNDFTRGDTFRVDSTSTYPTTGTTWMHVAGTFDGSTIRIYVNGQLQGTKAAATTIAANNVALGVGGQDNGYRSVRGSVDDVRIYNRAISQADVTELYNGTVPTNTAPVVNAGSNKQITLPTNSVNMTGSVTDDGKPAPVTSSWSVISKPTGSTVTFANTASPTTGVTFSAAGSYTLRLTATDTQLSASDDVVVTVNPVPQQGTDPAAWFKFDGNASNAGTLGGSGTLVNGPTYVTGKSGQALQFNTTAKSRVTVADTAALDATTALTLSAWIKPTSTATQYIIKKARSNVGDGYELGLSSTGRLFFRLNDFTSGDTYRIDSTSTYPTNGTWTHVAGVFDGSTIRIYVNGVQQNSKSANTTIKTNSYALGIGGQDDGYRCLNGAVDDARVYTRALTATEIQAIYNPAPQPVLPYAQAATFAQQQLLGTLAQINNSTSTFVSRTGSTGNWVTVTANDWTSGFLAGNMWQLYHLTGDTAWQTRATSWTTPLASQATSKTEDLFFRLMTSYGHLYESSGSSTHRQVLLNAAASRMTQWNETVGAFETDWRDSSSGDPRANYAVLMDQTSDALLVYWAGKQLNNQTYIDRAVRHVRTVMNNLVRADGSTYQFMYFDSATGDAISGETSQGYANESTWSRGQAWAVYFLTAFARETGYADILAKAKQVTDYFIANSPADGVPFWDFEHPSIPNTYRDSSAAAIAAAGMLDLSAYLTDPTQKAAYKAAAEKILNSLSGPGYLAQGTTSKGILLHGAQNIPNVPASADVSLIFGDYYFLEAIKRYRAMS